MQLLLLNQASPYLVPCLQRRMSFNMLFRFGLLVQLLFVVDESS